MKLRLNYYKKKHHCDFFYQIFNQGIGNEWKSHFFFLILGPDKIHTQCYVFVLLYDVQKQINVSRNILFFFYCQIFSI